MSYFRRPKTANEKRQSQNCKYVRSKRKSKNIVSSYDDLNKSRPKNWKNYRKTQYRPIPNKTKRKSKSFWSPQVHKCRIESYYIYFDLGLGDYVKAPWIYHKEYIY